MHKRKVSITYTVLIWAGITLIFLGAITAMMGLGESAFFEASLGGIKIRTTQTGLVILFVGAVLAGIVAVKIPKGIMVLQETNLKLTTRLIRIMPLLSLIIATLAIVFLILSLL